MKQYNRDEYNLMCAKFLEWETYNDIFYRIPAHLQDHSGIKQDIVLDGLIFDTDWNWIMEVAKKIYSTINPSSSKKHDLISFIGRGGKEQAVEEIWDYLNWYYGKINN